MIKIQNIFKFAFLFILVAAFFLVDPGHHSTVSHAAMGDSLGLGLMGIGFMGSTNKVVLREIDQFMTGYQPKYQGIMNIFLGNSQAYSEEVGKIDFIRANTVGDIRSRVLTPKDTEIHQISVSESSKTFKKYFLASQFQQSALQDRQGIEDVLAQVLDEHVKQSDEIFLLGQGTSNSTMLNNSLYHSADDNYVLESSAELDTDGDPLTAMHSKIMENVADADEISGKKVILFYGSEVIAKYDSLYAAQPIPFKRTLKEVLGDNYSLAKIPSAITPANSNGWIVANLDQVKLHYTTLAKLKAQGVNDEKMYAWFNFLMGSSMLEVLAEGAIIRQPVTFEA